MIVYGGDAYYETHMFKIDNGNLTYVDKTICLLPVNDAYINPTRYTMSSDRWVVGTNFFLNDYAIGSDGKPVPLYTVEYTYELPFVTKIDLTGTKIDENGNVLQENFVVPKSTPMAVTGLYTDTDGSQMVILDILDEGSEDYVTVAFDIEPVQSNEVEDCYSINGHYMSECFYRIFYAGA